MAFPMSSWRCCSAGRLRRSSGGGAGSPPTLRTEAPAEAVLAAPRVEPGGKLDLVVRAVAAAYLVFLLAAVLLYKSAFLKMVTVSPLLTCYSLVVVCYITSRFLFCSFYRTCEDHGLEPHVAVIMPAFNEEAAIARSLCSLLDLDYPADKLEIVAVNDGSTDRTLAVMQRVAASANGRVRVINFSSNRGKRAAMAAGIRTTDAEIIAFVDSDSVLEAEAMRILMQRFHDPEVGGACGHADVLNVRCELDDEDAGGPLLRGLLRQQGCRVGLQRGDLLFRLLLGLSSRSGDAAP